MILKPRHFNFQITSYLSGIVFLPSLLWPRLHNLIHPHITNVTHFMLLHPSRLFVSHYVFFANDSFLYNIGNVEHFSKATVAKRLQKSVALKRVLNVFVVFSGHKPVRDIKKEFHSIAGE